MNRFMVGFALVACAMGAPSGIVAPAGYANVGALGYAHGGALVSAPVAHAPAVVGQTHASYAAGPAVVENRVEYGVVGSRTVQTGAVSVVAGHQYAVAGHEAIPQPATSYVAGAPQNLVETVPLAAPVIPAAPAPADTVTQTRIAAPVRTHTRITPQVTNIVPEVVVSKYNVDVPVAVPRAVPREIITHKHVAKPYEVPVPRAVHVAAPYKVHPVQEIIETPHIHHATVETHSTQAVVTAHATPVHAVSQVAVAAPAAAYAAAPAVASVAAGYGYAAAPAVAAGYGYAAAPAVAAGYGYAAAPAVAAPAVVA